MFCLQQFIFRSSLEWAFQVKNHQSFKEKSNWIESLDEVKKTILNVMPDLH